jgi:hypothetical protein
MAVDFSALLRRPSGTSKRPKALVAGSYPAKIKKWEVGDKNQNQTPYVRFHLALLGWPESADDSDKFQEGQDAGQLIPIDLSKRQLSADVYIRNRDGSDAMYKIDDLLRSCGIEPDGTTPYEQLLPRLEGVDVLADVAQYINQKTGEAGNQVNRIVGVQ